MTCTRLRALREAALVVLGFAGLTAVFTAPLAFKLGSIAYRITNGDGQFSIWNTAWVARALVKHPTAVFDANIFFPHRGTLAYSEANLGSGALAIPVYWTTGNVYAAHGTVVLLAFVLSGIGAYYFVRALTADRVAATVAAIAFAFCPHVFSHLLHIQLLWIAGLPWTLLAFHRLIDRPSPGRGLWLGFSMSATLYLCAYYAVFLVLVVGALACAVAAWRGTWRDRRFWIAMTTSAASALLLSLPLLVPYVRFQRATGFVRPIGASDGFSADWQAYLASPAYAHAWLLPYLGHWNEVLFPGFIVILFAAAALVGGWREDRRSRETIALYGGTGLLALWASFGPVAGLYRLLYATVPAFSLMRAPSRFGVVVILACVVLSGLGIAMVRRRGWLQTRASIALLLTVVVAEHAVPLEFQAVVPPPPAYVALASLPDGAVLELPVYSERFQFVRAKYMLASTIHWKPIVNAYSDYIPAEFEARMAVLGAFPNTEALELLRRDGVRYAVFHLDEFGALRTEVERQIERFASDLMLRYEDASTRIYELRPSRD